MTLHNRCAQILIWTTLIAALPAAAQSTTQTCISGAVNPIVRAEGYSERAGDLAITCAGGEVTASGNAVPAVTITVAMNTIITSKVTSTAFTPNYNEALLLIDEPGTVGFINNLQTSNSINNCGSANAPFDTDANTGICTIKNDANGGGASIYNGSIGHPNVFQGRQLPGSNNQIIQFIGIPIDGGTHTLRITNVRGNAVFLSGGRVTSNNFGVGLTFQTFVVFSPNSVNAQGINVTNGSIRNGLDSVIGNPAGPYLQCASASGSVSGGSITLTEGFPSAWKVRNWRQINDNGSFSEFNWQYTGTAFYNVTDMVQNVPGAQYNTESGFMYPAPGTADLPPINPPAGISNSIGVPSGQSPLSSGVGDPTGISNAGTVTNGTRFAIKFANIPAGVTISVPGQVNLKDSSGGTGTIGAMLTVATTDFSGSGGTVGAGNLTSSGATFTAIYEVIFEDPFALETATIPVTANVNSANPQTNLTATAQVGFAPWYSSVFGSGSATLPNFINSFSAPVNLFSFTPCTQLSGLITTKTGAANARVWTATLSNIGSSPAAASQVTGLTLLQTFGPACTPVITTPFPVAVGDLAPSATGSGNVTIDFSTCNALARFTTTLSYSSDAGVVTGSKTVFNQFR